MCKIFNIIIILLLFRFFITKNEKRTTNSTARTVHDSIYAYLLNTLMFHTSLVRQTMNILTQPYKKCKAHPKNSHKIANNKH